MTADAAVLVGSTATFTCQTNYSIVCWIYTANIFYRNTVDVCRKGRDDKFIDRCNVTTSGIEGTYILTISDVQLNDAGFYICGDCSTVKATTHLLVLGRNLYSVT